MFSKSHVILLWWSISIIQISPKLIDCEKQSPGGVLRNFVKLTGKHLCQSLFFKVFSCEFCGITEHLRATASRLSQVLLPKSDKHSPSSKRITILHQNRVILQRWYHQHSFVSNCRGYQIANFGGKKPTSSFNYYKRMT